jgi:uncharacterized repeat protein (TIGR01451 family)
MNSGIDATSGRLGKVIGALVASMAIGLLAPAMAAAAADLSVTKSDSADPISRGQTLTYTIVVHNAGPAVATATAVEDKLPGGLDFISASTTAGTCSTQGKTVTCALGTLAALADETVTIRTRVTKNKGTIDNTATVSTTEPDPTSPNNSDTERTTVKKAATGPTCQGSAATIIGTGAGETLTGTGHRDVIIAGGGNDVVLSGDGSDKVCAGSGLDLVRSGPKGDAVKGGGGADRLKGGGGADALRGGPGRDRLRGGAGPDLLAGGLGIDLCRGGAGADTLRSCP